MKLDFTSLYRELESYAFQPQHAPPYNIFIDLMMERPIPFLRFLQKELTTATFYNIFYLVFLILIFPWQFSDYWQCSKLSTLNLIVIMVINIFVLPFKYMILHRLTQIKSTIHLDQPGYKTTKVMNFFFSRILNFNAKISKLLMVAYVSCFYSFPYHIDKNNPFCQAGIDLSYLGVVLTFGFLIKIFITYIRFKNLYFNNYLGYGKIPEQEMKKMKMEKIRDDVGLAEKRKMQEKCVICWDEFNIGDDLRTLSCTGKHFFHVDCIDNWLSKYSKCPICSQVFISNSE